MAVTVKKVGGISGVAAAIIAGALLMFAGTLLLLTIPVVNRDID